MKLRRAAFITIVTLLLVAGFASVALADQASYLGGKVRTGDVVTVPASETVRSDLYIFAGTITVDGTIDGDLVASGGQITVNGNVNGSIMAAGSVVLVNGQTKGAVRAAAGQVTINGPVGRDAVVASGQFSTTPGAKIGQDVLMATGSTSLGGAVAGSVFGSSGTYTRSGSIGGSEQVQLTGSEGRPEPRIERDPVGDAIRQLVAVILAGLLFLWLRPRLMPAWDTLLRARPAAAFGYGILALVGFIAALIVAFIAIVVFAIILGALTLGALVVVDVFGGLLLVTLGILAFAVVCAFIVDAIVGYVLGRAILRTTRLGLAEQWQAAAELALGAVIVVGAESLPIVGGFAKLAVILAGLGVLSLYVWSARAGSRVAATTPAA